MMAEKELRGPRAYKVERWIRALPPGVQSVELRIQDGDEWSTEMVWPGLTPDRAKEVAEFCDDAIQGAADESGKTVRAMVVAELSSGKELPLRLRGLPSRERGSEAVADPSEFDGSARSLATQAQHHVEVTSRLALQERHATMQAFQETLRVQQELITRLSDRLERAEASEEAYRTVALELRELAAEESDGEEGGSEMPPQMAALLTLAGQVLAKRLSAPPAKKDVVNTERPSPPAEGEVEGE